MTTFNTYANDKQFSAGLGQLTTMASKIDGLCHSLLVAALSLAAPGSGGDRNVDRVRRVLERFPASSRREAAIRWCKHHAPLVINTKEGISVKMRKDAGDWKFANEPASYDPFWEMSKKKAASEYDLAKAAAQFLKKAEKNGHDVSEALEAISQAGNITVTLMQEPERKAA